MIRRVPHHLAFFQRADHTFQILAVDHVLVGAQPAPGLQPVDDRVIVGTIDANPRLVHAEHSRAHFQCQEMNADQQNSALLRLHIANMLKADGVGPAGDSANWPEPGHTGLHQPHANRFEVHHHHPVTFLLAFLGEAELKVAIGDLRPALHKAHGQAADGVPDAVDQRVGQLDNQPQQADTQPQQPIARMQQRRRKFRQMSHFIPVSVSNILYYRIFLPASQRRRQPHCFVKWGATG